MQDSVNVTQADAAASVIGEMLDTRRQQLASCERMLELLQPEWDKFEARTGHDVYVAREYADHTSGARTHRKEIAALETALARLSAPSQEVVEECENLDDLIGELRAHADDMPPCIQRDYMRLAADRFERILTKLGVA